MQDVQRYHYGVKARLQFAVPADRAAALLKGLESYAVSGMHYTGGTAFEDPYQRPTLRTEDVLLASKSYDVSIAVSTTNRDDIVRVSISTFSSHCGATEDWRPYWRAFRIFLARWRRA